MIDPLAAAQQGPAATLADWRRAAEATLRGASLDSLAAALPDGIRLSPLQPPAPHAGPVAGRPAGSRWRIVQRVEHPDPAEANRLALADLEGGAGGLALVFEDTPAARGFGLPPSPAALERALEAVRLDLIGLRIEAGASGAAMAEALAALARRQGIAPGGLDVTVSAPDVAPTDALPRLRLDADGRPFHEAGATPAQELGATLAAAIGTLRRLEGLGLPLDAARKRISFTLAADTDIVQGLAKMRALRLIWTRAEAACGLEPLPALLHVETSWRVLTRLDPPTNILRGTLGAFAGGVGGADSVTVLPYTGALGLPDAFARRVARNAQHVMMEEANLHRVEDPAAGSGAIEAVTQALCEKAWAFMQRIEAHGGLAAALASGWLAGTLADNAPAPGPKIVGTTLHPLVDETPSAVLPVAAGRPVETALKSRRLAEPFEERRP